MKEQSKTNYNIGDLVYNGRDTGHETADSTVRYIILIRYGGVCQICKRMYNKRLALVNQRRYFSSFHVDHIIPYSRGGRNHIDNYQLLCRDCNLKKSNTIAEE